MAAFGHLREELADARLLVVCGPRIDRAAIEAAPGVEIAGYVDDLPGILAGCDLAIVQSGLATTMELVAARRPFIHVPLREHFEQNHHVAHRLRRHGAPEPTPYEQTEPRALAALMLERLRRRSTTSPSPLTVPRARHGCSRTCSRPYKQSNRR